MTKEARQRMGKALQLVNSDEFLASLPESPGRDFSCSPIQLLPAPEVDRRILREMRSPQPKDVARWKKIKIVD